MPPRRRRRPKPGPNEQLSFNLEAVTPPPPVVPVDRMVVGYFAGVKMSTGEWWLTVDEPKHSYLVEERTPQRWWAECARDEYTLHGWCSEGRYIQTERDDLESPILHFETRTIAQRWLRSFNESFQNWRMEAWA